MATLNVGSEIPVDKDTREEIVGSEKKKSCAVGEKLFIITDEDDDGHSTRRVVSSPNSTLTTTATEEVIIEIDTSDGSILSCVKNKETIDLQDEEGKLTLVLYYIDNL